MSENKNTILFNKLTEKRRILSQQLKNPAAVGFWNMVVDKYSDQAHFIYELLQNADDAQATEVRITLFEDKINFIHNGKIPFCITDPEEEKDKKNIGHLNAITSIGASTKEDGNTIGKFGVGFKSVFQYTDTPHIEDDHFSFRIVDFIVPEEEPLISSDRRPGETLFSLPFKNPATAFPDIEKKLSTLHLPLLFLQSLQKITWETSRGTFGSYAKEKEQTRILQTANRTNPVNENEIQYTFVKLKKESEEETQTEYLHTFTQDLFHEKQPYFGTIAFGADENGSLLTDKNPEPAFCFFPTKEPTDVKMLLHAPFLLTDSRETIKQGEKWNQDVIDRLALLAADSVELLCQIGKEKNRGWINDNLFEIIPVEKNRFFRKEKNDWIPIHPFHPFYSRFQQKLSEAPLFLSAENRYLNKTKTRYATEKIIGKLFSSEQLAELSGNRDELQREWCFSSFYMGSSSERNEQIRQNLQYIKENALIGSLISPEYLAQHLSSEFIKAQSIEWLQRFYAFVATQKTLWANPESPLRYKPFILCADGEVWAPFSAENNVMPRIYLSGGIENDFPAVHPDLLLNEQNLHFFETKLGLTHPGLLAEIELSILPRYRRKEILPSDTGTIYRHLNCFVECFTSLSFQEEKRNAFLRLFQNVSFLPARHHAGVVSLQPASTIYIEIPALKCFLQNDPQACFLDNSVVENGFSPEKREDLYRFLTAVGVSSSIKIKEIDRPAKKEFQVKLKLHPKSLRQYDKGAQKISDKEIDGFTNFFAYITPESSKALSDLLIRAIQEQGSFMFRLSLEGEYCYIEKSKQSYTTETISETTAYQSLLYEPWLFNKKGKNVCARELDSTEELSHIYDKSCPDLFFFLGIPHDATLANLSATQRKAISVVKELEKNGISLKMLKSISEDRELMEWIKSKKTNE